MYARGKKVLKRVVFGNKSQNLSCENLIDIYNIN